MGLGGEEGAGEMSWVSASSEHGLGSVVCHRGP